MEDNVEFSGGPTMIMDNPSLGSFDNLLGSTHMYHMNMLIRTNWENEKLTTVNILIDMFLCLMYNRILSLISNQVEFVITFMTMTCEHEKCPYP